MVYKFATINHTNTTTYLTVFCNIRNYTTKFSISTVALIPYYILLKNINNYH